MKRIILTLVISALSILYCIGQQGYLIVVDNGKKHEVIKTVSIVEVYTVTNLYLPGNCIDIESVLKKSSISTLSIYVGNTGIYIEKKRVIKIKKNGELILRRYKIKKGHN